jgi:hypothetical protein
MKNRILMPIEIFDDGLEPATCCRKAYDKDKTCPFLYAKKFGSIDLCALFRDKCGKDVELTRYSEAGLLKPAEECLKKRII